MKIDFAEAERRALEEAERIKQLGYDRQREEEEEKAKKEAEALQAAANLKAQSSEIGYKTNGNIAAQRMAAPGFTRLGFGAIPGAATAKAATTAPTSNSRCLNTVSCSTRSSS